MMTKNLGDCFRQTEERPADITSYIATYDDCVKVPLHQEASHVWTDGRETACAFRARVPKGPGRADAGVSAQHFESAALSTESGGRRRILRCAGRSVATVTSAASGTR